MGKPINESTSVPNNPYSSYHVGKDVEVSSLADLFSMPQKNHEFAEFTPPPPSKKVISETSVAIEQYEKIKNQEKEELLLNPWLADSLAKAGSGEDLFSSFYAIPREKEADVEAREIVEEDEFQASKPSITDELNAAIAEFQELKKSGKIENHFEARYVDRLVSLSTETTDQAAPPTKEEEVSWGKKIVNTVGDWWNTVTTAVTGLWNKLTGNDKPVEKTNETEAVEGNKPVQPLNNRPMLEEPSRVQKEQLKKLIREANLILEHMQESMKEAEELMKNSNADVAMMKMIQKTSLRQNELNHEDVTERTNSHTELLERNKKLIELINQVREELSSKENMSNKLGWINTGLTAVALVGTLWLVFASGGAAIGIISAAAGGFNGIGTIVKGKIDHDLRKQKGDIDFKVTSRQLNSHRMEANVSDMDKVIAEMHQDIERIIAMLAMIRETIRYGQMLS